MYHKLFLLTLVLCTVCLADAQKKETGLDYFHKPTTSIPRYWAVSEKRDSGWYEEVFYYPEKSLYVNGMYEDEECHIANGEVNWYYSNRYQKIKAMYSHGKLSGLYLDYSENGLLSDSIVYQDGHKSGIGFRFYDTGELADSLNFDGKGNGVQVHYYKDGMVSFAGFWVSDTSKNKRWKYYYPDGTLKATEEYNNGSLVKTTCYDKTGEIKPGGCNDHDAMVETGSRTWQEWIAKTIDAGVPARKKAPVGTYTVAVRFVINQDGQLTDIKPLTAYGFGMEQEVIRMLKKSPKWHPAVQFGEPVNAYRIQPVTFTVIED